MSSVLKRSKRWRRLKNRYIAVALTALIIWCSQAKQSNDFVLVELQPCRMNFLLVKLFSVGSWRCVCSILVIKDKAQTECVARELASDLSMDNIHQPEVRARSMYVLKMRLISQSMILTVSKFEHRLLDLSPCSIKVLAEENLSSQTGHLKRSLLDHRVVNRCFVSLSNAHLFTSSVATSTSSQWSFSKW